MLAFCFLVRHERETTKEQPALFEVENLSIFKEVYLLGKQNGCFINLQVRDPLKESAATSYSLQGVRFLIK